MFAREDSAENGGMRSKEEIRGIVTGFAQSRMTRHEYCARHGVAMTTFDYWRRAQRKRPPRLVQVAMEEAPASGFALVLANGRRIESSWNFSAAALEKLGFQFYRWPLSQPESGVAIRLVTSYATSSADVDEFIGAARRIS